MMSSSNKLRVLAIHGYTQSDAIFSGKLGSLRKGFKKEIEFTFINAPHKVLARDNVELSNEENSGGNGYGWWFNTEDHIFKATVSSELSVGFEDSLKLVERTFEECGPFDGILGFSQGAAFATILCAIQQKKLSQIRFNFAIIISGFKSLCGPHAIYYNEEISIPSLHIYGESDKVIPTAMAQELCDLFSNKKKIIHDGGHYIPSKKEFYKDFITEMLENKNINNV